MGRSLSLNANGPISHKYEIQKYKKGYKRAPTCGGKVLHSLSLNANGPISHKYEKHKYTNIQICKYKNTKKAIKRAPHEEARCCARYPSMQMARYRTNMKNTNTQIYKYTNMQIQKYKKGYKKG